MAKVRRVGRTASVKAMQLANLVVEDYSSYSRISDPDKEESIPCFEKEEIIPGDLLGKGGFNQVFAVDSIQLLQEGRGRYAPKTSSRVQQEKRKQLAQSAVATPNQYAMKFLKREAMEHPDDYGNGAADLMIETKILSKIESHPNIITLHGIAAAGVGGFGEGTEGAYFLLLDQLSVTLDQRLQSWKENENEVPLLKRIKVGFDISSALAHLHEHNIVFRDLKPDNIGFDADDKLKLFDFGLSKEIDPRQEITDETYKMSGNTGTLRYMAPEVVVSKPYGLKADVYGFGILLWEVCALEVAYKDMSVVEHSELVVNGDTRLEPKKNWPEELSNLMKWSWMVDQAMRPPMAEVRRALKSALKSRRLQTKRRLSLPSFLGTSSAKPSSHVESQVCPMKKQEMSDTRISAMSILEAEYVGKADLHPPVYRRSNSETHIDFADAVAEALREFSNMEDEI